MPDWPGFSIEILPEIDSTNTELMRRARKALHDPVLLIAERQTAGRGRLGRAWHGELGHALTFSLGLPYQPHNWSGLSLAVGLSLAESLGPDIQLKWPNDLWRQQRKLGGILIEAASQGGGELCGHWHWAEHPIAPQQRPQNAGCGHLGVLGRGNNPCGARTHCQALARHIEAI